MAPEQTLFPRQVSQGQPPRTAQIFAQISRDVELARQLIAEKRRQQALLSLRKKKLHEQRVDTLDAYLLNVEQVLHRCLLVHAPGKEVC